MAYSPVGLQLISRDGLPPEISSLPELEYLVRDQKQAFLYSTLAMLTLVLYEYAITLNMEVKFIWGSKDLISITNILFVINRYYPIIRAVCYVVFSLHPPQGPDADVLCANWTDFNSWSTMVNVATVETLMLSRTWALYGKSRIVGLLLLTFWLCAFATAIGIVKSGLVSFPAVIGLAPMAVLPCDRPSPYKYMIVYCAALLLELISFLFMMGRVMHLMVKSKVHSRARVARGPSAQSRSLALPLIRGLQWHGLSYFAAVIFVMAFTVYSSFNARLARAVVNSGVAPTITSIACNRVFFALRGLYFDVTVRGGEAVNRTPAGSPQPPPFFSSMLCPRKAREAAAVHAQVMMQPKMVDEDLTKEMETNYTYDDEIAITRNDIETRDLNASSDYLRNRDERGRVDTGRAAMDKEVQGVFRDRRLVFPGVRPSGPLGTPFHTHGTSSSTVLTSDDSAHGTLSTGEEDTTGIATRATPGHGRSAGFGHVKRGTSKSSSKFLASPGSVSSHATAGGKRSLSSLSGIIRSPTREESGAGFEGAVEDTPISTSPRTHGISERLGSIWRIKKDGREGSGSSAYQDGVVNARSADEDATQDRSKNREREREKEKHPLDHHYEMETIHSEMHDQEWSLGGIEDTEGDDYREGRPRSGRMQGNVNRTGLGGLGLLEEDPPGVITPHSSRSLELGLFYHE